MIAIEIGEHICIQNQVVQLTPISHLYCCFDSYSIQLPELKSTVMTRNQLNYKLNELNRLRMKLLWPKWNQLLGCSF